MNKHTARLQITTPTDRKIAMTRVFDAPRALVYEAWTTPAIVQRWLGVHGGWSMVVCEIDLKVGGTFRFAWRNRDEREMGMRGVHREVVPAERIVATQSFDDPWYEGEAVSTVVFIEQGGRTTLTSTVLYTSREVRDAVLRSPMERGVAAGFDKLADLLASGAA